MSYMTYEITPTRWPVKAWPKIRELIGPNEAHVAGGYASWHMSDRFSWHFEGQACTFREAVYDNVHKTLLPSNTPQDLDIFTYSEDTYNAIAGRLFKVGFRALKTSDNCTTWEDTRGFLKEDNWSHLRYGLDNKGGFGGQQHGLSRFRLPIQLIKPVFGKNLIEVLDHFDFYLAKFAILDDGTMLAHKDALKLLDEKILKHAHPEAILERPFYVLGRYMKYVHKGYSMNYMELLKLVVNAQAAGIRSADIDLAQIEELVKHFGRYLHNGERMQGMGEDFRPTMEEAYTEWLRYLLAKKAKIQ